MDTRALTVGAAALGMAAGVGIGYAIFHSSTKPATTATASRTTSPAVSTGSFTLEGTLTLKATYGGIDNVDNQHCSGMGGYSDIASGASVTITDQAGTVIATGQLGDGNLVGTDAGTGNCVFEFSVPSVPAGKTFYGVQVSHRGAIQFSSAQAQQGDVAMSLGS